MVIYTQLVLDSERSVKCIHFDVFFKKIFMYIIYCIVYTLFQVKGVKLVIGI